MFYRSVGSFLLFAILPAWALDKALVDELAKLPTQEERKPKWFHVAIVQDGRILPVIKHCVRLTKKPFSVVVISKGPSEAGIHFTPVKSRFELALKGRSLPWSLGSVGSFSAEKSQNPDREIWIEYGTGSHYWYHKDDKESRYHERHRRGKMEIYVRHVKQVLINTDRIKTPTSNNLEGVYLKTESTMAGLPLNEIFIIPWSDEFVKIPNEPFLTKRKALPSFMMLDFFPKSKEYEISPKVANPL